MPKSPTRPTQYPSPQWARALHRGKPRHSCRGGRPHPPPTRGHTMKFTRRPDLAPQTRIDIVMLAWLHQGVYGKMTEIAQCYQISRTFLYQLLFLANLQLETLFSDEKRLFQKQRSDKKLRTIQVPT